MIQSLEALIDQTVESEETGPLTGVCTRYSKTVTDVMGDIGIGYGATNISDILK